MFTLITKHDVSFAAVNRRDLSSVSQEIRFAGFFGYDLSQDMNILFRFSKLDIDTILLNLSLSRSR